ncbi:NUDIX domain-containing protein [Dongshaea marina]|uniref:NUDIX domain-containing protein n=1 Tax=Dongshaea marina TaxID=2047966 RepID=UPI00131ED440|nr:NUDIX domain-containing protein [Dongshaea marina]
MDVILTAIILIQDHKVLLGLRQNTESFAELWGLPGGRVEAGESPCAAAFRELEEELGITPETLEGPQVITEADAGRISYIYCCHRWHGEVQNKEPALCRQLSWYPLDALPESMVPFCREGILGSLPRSEPSP